MKFSRRAVVLLVIAVVLAACSSASDDNENGSSTTGAAGAGENVVLRIAGDGYGHTADAVAAFEASHPGITVEYAEGQLTFEEGVPQALLQSGEGPDILYLNSGPGRAGELAKAGLIADLTELYDRLDLAALYPASLIEQLEALENGRITELIELVSAFRIFYNTEMFADAGIEEPTSWEELLESCGDLAALGVSPMTLGTRSGFAAGWLGGVLLASSAGSEVLTDVIYNGATFNNPDVVLGYEMLQELVDGDCIDGPTAASLDYKQSFATFYLGEAAMVAGNEFVLIEGVEADADISKYRSFAVPPRDSSRTVEYSAGPGKSWVMNAEAKERDAALEWLEWVTTDEYINIVVEAGSYVPARKLPAGAVLAPSLAGTAEILATQLLGYNPSNYFSGPGTQAWYESLQNVVTGSITPEEAAAAVQAALAASR